MSQIWDIYCKHCLWSIFGPCWCTKSCKTTFYAHLARIWKLARFTRFIWKVFATKILLSGKFSLFVTLLPVLIDFQVVWVALWLKLSPESWQNLLPLYLTMLKEKPLMILLQRIVSSHLTCGHKNTGRLILKGEKVQNMLTPRLISENLIRTEICFDVYCYEKPAV